MTMARKSQPVNFKIWARKARHTKILLLAWWSSKWRPSDETVTERPVWCLFSTGICEETDIDGYPAAELYLVARSGVS
jgi:hypothetical protein